MPSDFLPDLKAGDPISAAWLNALKRLVMRNRLHVDSSNGLIGAQGLDGTTLALVKNAGLVGVVRILTTSTISARSGTTAGSGTANLVTNVGTALNTNNGITIYNISGGSGGTGKYGWAAQLDDGTYWLVSLEC